MWQIVRPADGGPTYNRTSFLCVVLLPPSPHSILDVCSSDRYAVLRCADSSSGNDGSAGEVIRLRGDAQLNRLYGAPAMAMLSSKLRDLGRSAKDKSFEKESLEWRCIRMAMDKTRLGRKRCEIRIWVWAGSGRCTLCCAAEGRNCWSRSRGL